MLNITKSISHIFHAALLFKLFVLMINLVNQLFFTGERVQSINLFKKFLKSMIIVKM